jgi:flavin reductase (DIM6/NTAB) family NADH-FMN oxidoreductase RutF
MAKKKLGQKTLLYPMPVVIVGANVDGKVNFNTIAYCGVAQSQPPMLSISMDKKRHTHKGILENKTFSVNIPSESMIQITDYIGISSGTQIDKSTLFEIFYGSLKTAPMIDECPINIECSVVTILDFGGKNDLIVGKIEETYSDEEYLSNDIPDIKKVNPIVFTRYDHKYYGIGEYIGLAYTIGQSYRGEIRFS